MTALDRVLDALAVAGMDPKNHGEGYRSFCPVHEAGPGHKTPSLSIDQGSKGALIICRSQGCNYAAVAEAIGLSGTELFDDFDPDRGEQKMVEVARYHYLNADGSKRFDVVRYESDHAKSFSQQLPDRKKGELGGLEPVLYKLPELVEGIGKGRWVVVVEGEKDVHTLQAAGMAATTNPMGAGKWRDSYTEMLVGAKVAVIPDNDTPGLDHATSVATALDFKGIDVRIVTLDDLPVKGDVTDWINAGHTASELKELIRTAPTWEPSDEPGIKNGNDASDSSSWSEIDMSTIDPDRIPQPSVLFRDDLQPILYPGVRNVLFGPSESAKSWFAAHAIQQESEHLESVDPGGTRKAAVIIDFEDIPEVWKYRLRILGLDDDVINRRVAYHRPIDPPVQNEISHQLGDNLSQARLVVVDSMNESTYLFGLSISSNDDIGEWRNKFLRPIEACLNPDDPAAILVIDHTGHDENINRRAAIGAITKLTGVRGLQIRADVIEQPAPGKHGAIGLYVMKDTNGKVRAISRTEPDGKQYLGTFMLDPLSDVTDRIVASIVNPGLEAVETADLETILELFAKHDSDKGLSMNQFEKLSIGPLTMAARKKRLLVKHAAESGDLDTFSSGRGIRYRLSAKHRKEASGGSSHNGTRSDELASSSDGTNQSSDEAETRTPQGFKFVGRTSDEPRRGTSSQDLVPSLPIRDEVGDEPEIHLCVDCGNKLSKKGYCINPDPNACDLYGAERDAVEKWRLKHLPGPKQHYLEPDLLVARSGGETQRIGR